MFSTFAIVYPTKTIIRVD